MLVGAVLFSLRTAHCDYCGEIAMRVHTTRRGELYIDSALLHALNRPFKYCCYKLCDIGHKLTH